jgi:hypothetical protein
MSGDASFGYLANRTYTSRYPTAISTIFPGCDVRVFLKYTRSLSKFNVLCAKCEQPILARA